MRTMKHAGRGTILLGTGIAAGVILTGVAFGQVGPFDDPGPTTSTTVDATTTTVEPTTTTVVDVAESTTTIAATVEPAPPSDTSPVVEPVADGPVEAAPATSPPVVDLPPAPPVAGEQPPACTGDRAQRGVCVVPGGSQHDADGNQLPPQAPTPSTVAGG